MLILDSVAIPVNARILADIFALDLQTKENPNGSLNMATLYKHLVNVRIWGFNNNDVGMAWRRRMWAREGAMALTESTLATVEGIKRDADAKTLLGFLFSRRSARPNWAKPGSLRHYGTRVVQDLLAAGKTTAQVADICWLTALAGVSVPVGAVGRSFLHDLALLTARYQFAEILAFFLQPQNIDHWARVQQLAEQSASPDSSKRAKADATLREYVLEAQRLTSSQRNLRICVKPTTIDGQDFKFGEPLVTLFVSLEFFAYTYPIRLSFSSNRVLPAGAKISPETPPPTPQSATRRSNSAQVSGPHPRTCIMAMGRMSAWAARSLSCIWSVCCGCARGSRTCAGRRARWAYARASSSRAARRCT